jgi:ABC-type multidrug transport system permease subunit
MKRNKKTVCLKSQIGKGEERKQKQQPKEQEALQEIEEDDRGYKLPPLLPGDVPQQKQQQFEQKHLTPPILSVLLYYVVILFFIIFVMLLYYFFICFIFIMLRIQNMLFSANYRSYAFC